VHQGYWFYTVGQRGGIKLPGGPWYVTAKDIAMNVVHVSREYYAGDKQRRAFEAGPYNWVAGMGPREDLPLKVGAALRANHVCVLDACAARLGMPLSTLAMRCCT
jgi:tRNA U34 2-thiouridine synthase MnmA/TrmU